MRRILATLAVAGLATAAAGVLALAPAHAATAGCRVNYQIANQWPGGFQAQVAVTNLGDPLTGWRLAFDFSTDTQHVGTGWNGSITQAGRHVEITNPTWNTTLATNATATIGFNGTYVDVNPPPVNFTLNGVACTGAPSTSASPSPTASVSPSASASPSPSPSISIVSDPIAVTGVVQQGVEAGCLLLVPDWPNYPRTFLLIGGDPKVLVPGAHVMVAGFPENLVTTCMQGQALRVLNAYPVSGSPTPSATPALAPLRAAGLPD